MNKELLKRAQDSLVIEDIYLRESQVAINPEFDPKFAPENFQLQYKLTPNKISKMEVEHEGGPKTSLVRIETQTGMRLIPAGVTQEMLAKPEDAQKHIRVLITAIFVAEYRLTNSEIEKEALDEFAKFNVGYHVWPYWREYVQNMCGRMALPNIVLPMYRRRPVSNIQPEAVSQNAPGLEEK